MFVADEAWLDLGFGTARDRLAGLIRQGTFLMASREAYEKEGRALTRVGPFAGATGLSRLVEVQLGDLISQGGTLVLALRWQATGHGGGLFPTLDANLTLAPGEEHTSVLSLAGVYRPPFGPVGSAIDRALLHKVASTTIRAFLRQLADAIASQPSAVGRTADDGQAGPA